jgi:CRP/FNR family transcriptional regulator, cyclic AMP receptor protein
MRPPPDLAVIEAVRASPIARALTAEQSQALAGVVNLRSWQRGDVLAQEGMVDDRLIAIVEGSIAVMKHRGTSDESLLVTLHAGDLAHELGFLDGTPRHASLVAAEPARVLVLTRRALESLIEVQPRMVYEIMCAIVRAAHKVQARLSVQAVELMNYVFKQHGRY